MKQILLYFFVLSACFSAQAQAPSYVDSLQQYQQAYVEQHEVVTGADKQHMHFYPVSAAYKVTGAVALRQNSPWFLMESSGPLRKMYRVYATVSFRLRDTLVQMNIYQSQSLMQTEQYKEHLFVPFTDATSGSETYVSGRYLDLSIQDIKEGRMTLDFNKAYNPYCAYVSGRYNCPIPPKENRLPVAIRAGEKNYGQSH
jgi:uncharacterized protein